MTAALYARLRELAREGRDAAIATVVRTQGSTPQVAGAKLIVTDDPRGRAAGTLGGGCVEADAIEAAKGILASGGRSLRAYELTEDLAWNTGLVCGGTMWILAERERDALDADGQSMLEALVNAATGGTPIAIVTRLHRRGRELSFAGRLFVDADGRVTGALGDAAQQARAVAAAVDQIRHGTPRVVMLDDEHEVLIEPVAPRPRLFVAGGGHVALAIARQAQLLDFDVTVLEDRPEFADPARFGGALVLEGDVPSTIASLDYGWNSFLVVATRGHKLDADCVLAAARTGVKYIGLLGSRRKTVLIGDMLREQGIPEDRIAAIHAPVGLDLGGRTPAEIALSVMSEITQERYQASGRPLRQR
ncbi:MAG TPA: XdhC family protein [Vicinamibacterales bacterium]|nr:XdhC family protein [Vicinamibacterales bacterium]